MPQENNVAELIAKFNNPVPKAPEAATAGASSTPDEIPWPGEPIYNEGPGWRVQAHPSFPDAGVERPVPKRPALHPSVWPGNPPVWDGRGG
jgi:hypothetical protein